MCLYICTVILTRRFNPQTRSGNEFSPWAPGTSVRGVIVPLAANFDFGHLIREAIIRESELDDDDTEGCALEAITMPSSSCSLPIPPPLTADAPTSQPQPGPSRTPANAPASPPFLTADAPASQPQPGPSCTPANAPASQPSPSLESLTHGVPKYACGSVENSLRKKRGHTKRAMQRMEQKRAAPFSDYAVKPSVLNRHVLLLRSNQSSRQRGSSTPRMHGRAPETRGAISVCILWMRWLGRVQFSISGLSAGMAGEHCPVNNLIVKL
jgi:hypothetical protein